MSESYTFGSDEFMAAILQKQIGDLPGGKYPIELNTNDFKVFIHILQQIAMYGEISRAQLNDLIGWDANPEFDPIEEWAWHFLSGIGETLGVEGI